MIARFAARTLMATMGAALAFACGVSSSYDVVIATRDDAAPPSFTSPDAGDGDASNGTGVTVTFCATNECPAGRASCPNNPFPCAGDLSTDDDNCGACGHHCPDLSATAHGDMLHAAAKCTSGSCRFTCRSGYADCNGFIEDGCEADLSIDSQNCGGCGMACPASDVCDDGVCVCPVRESCGACGNICPPPTGPAFPRAWHAEYGCVDGQCNQPSCSGTFDDCNGDFPGVPEGDGCEADLYFDAKNCSKCGLACGPGETCERGACRCPCGAPCFQDRLRSDVENCGGCGFRCPGVDTLGMANGTPVCDEGVCDFRCNAGWADCDGDDQNGCETNLASDPLNCGRCNVRCDGVDGQACVDGTCTMKECGVVQ